MIPANPGLVPYFDGHPQERSFFGGTQDDYGNTLRQKYNGLPIYIVGYLAIYLIKSKDSQKIEREVFTNPKYKFTIGA